MPPLLRASSSVSPPNGTTSRPSPPSSSTPATPSWCSAATRPPTRRPALLSTPNSLTSGACATPRSRLSSSTPTPPRPLAPCTASNPGEKSGPSFGLHHRTNSPGNEFLVAHLFGAGAPPGCHFQQQVENLPAHGLHSGCAIGDAARVHVHVVAHAAERVAVSGDLENRNGGEADGASAPGSERDQVATAGAQTGQRWRVIPGRVHENEAGRRYGFGILVDVDQRRGAALGHRAQRFFQDVAQPAGFVAGCGIVVETALKPA